MSYTTGEQTSFFSTYQKSSNFLTNNSKENFSNSSNDSDFNSDFSENKSTSILHCTTFRLAVALISTLMIIILFLSIHSSSSSSAVAAYATNGLKLASDDSDMCEKDSYFKKILKEQWSVPIAGLIKNLHGTKKYEASSIAYDSQRDVYWVVFDSLYALGKLNTDLVRSSSNTLVPSVTDGYIGIEDSGFEGIAFDADTDFFYLLTESMPFDTRDGTTVFYSVIRQIRINAPTVVNGMNETYDTLHTCMVDHEFESDNKGFEELQLIMIDDEQYFMAICEGNYCKSGSEGRESGNGRLVIIDFHMHTNMIYILEKYPFLENTNINCLYKFIETVNLPENVDFMDYSALGLKVKNSATNEYKIVIGSQENSAIWISSAIFNLKEFIFSEKWEILKFPKNDMCETVFCNIEGVIWVDDTTFIAVSDRAKKDGDQNFVCKSKDQSVHLFQAQ